MDVQPQVPNRTLPLFLLPLRSSHTVGSDIEEGHIPQRAQPHESPGPADLLQVEVTGPSLPEDLLTLTADIALEVDPPPVLRVWAEAEGGEGDADLGEPSLIGSPGLHFPDSVPVPVHRAPVVGDEGIGHRPVRVRGEEVPVAVVVEGVQDHFEVVLTGPPEVPGHLVGQDPVRLGVESPEPHVEGLGIEEKGHLGALGHGRPEVQLPLGEVRNVLSALPGRFVQEPVDADVLTELQRDNGGGVTGLRERGG